MFCNEAIGSPGADLSRTSGMPGLVYTCGLLFSRRLHWVVTKPSAYIVFLVSHWLMKITRLVPKSRWEGNMPEHMCMWRDDSLDTTVHCNLSQAVCHYDHILTQTCILILQSEGDTPKHAFVFGG